MRREPTQGRHVRPPLFPPPALATEAPSMKFTLRGRLVAAGLLLLSLLAATVMVDWKQGEDLLIQRKYKEAAEALEKGLADAPPGERDRVLLLLGRAQLLAGQSDAAIASFQRLMKEYGGSGLVHQASFQEARALERAGKVREAAVIYRGQIERLIGTE